MKTHVGLIRVLTVKDRELLNSHGRLIEEAFPDLRVINRCIENQPQGIYDSETKRMAIPKIIALGKEMVKENIRALIISCADDPGVGELRRILDIPVIGAGSSAACFSLSLGFRIGSLSITQNTPPIMKEILDTHLVAETRPKGIKTSLDLLTDRGKRNTIEAAEYLRSKGADAIALSCTGYSTLRIAKELEKTIGLPVIDAVVAAGLFTWYLTCRR